MTKREIIKEIEDLYKLLSMDPEQYAEKMNKEMGVNALTANNSSNHKIGVANAILYKILMEEKE